MNFLNTRFASGSKGALPALNSLVAVFVLLTLSACSSLQVSSDATAPAEHARNSGNRFLNSGTIILSHSLPSAGPSAGETVSVAKLHAPEADKIQLASSDLASSDEVVELPAERPERKLFAPLIGYFPPAHAYLPADNETWLEVDSTKKKLTLFKGKSAIKEILGEGDVSIGEGDYYLQHKQKQPLWYAPDDYFTKRKLNVPGAGDRLRYRRGALGSYALYPTTTFPIHCGPVWSQDVGGLRVSAAELSSIYYMLPVGAPIVVK